MVPVYIPVRTASLPCSIWYVQVATLVEEMLAKDQKIKYLRVGVIFL